jgi:phage antirepressor YoqD-like protein
MRRLFKMKNLVKEKFMTSLEVSRVLGVHRNTVLSALKKLYPKNVKNGIASLLNEEMVTAVKIHLTKKVKVADVKTDLEKRLLIQQAMNFLNEDIEKLREENKILKPKADFYDTVTGSKDTIDIGQVAKLLNKRIGRNTLFMILRDELILDKKNIPYQTYIDRGYFRVIESTFTKPDGSNHINLKTVVYQKGIDYINKVIDNNRSIK